MALCRLFKYLPRQGMLFRVHFRAGYTLEMAGKLWESEFAHVYSIDELSLNAGLSSHGSTSWLSDVLTISV